MGFFDLRDFVSLACLTNTPYPNNFAVAATGIDKVDNNAKDVVVDLFSHKDYSVVIKRMRLFVAWGLADLDADLGYWIRQRMWDWQRVSVKRPADQGVSSGDVEKMRRDIYGPCKKGGHDYFNYQPCPPTWQLAPYKTLKDWEAACDHFNATHDDKAQQLFSDARIKLSADWQQNKKGVRARWAYVVDAMAYNLGIKPALLGSGLKGEF